MDSEYRLVETYNASNIAKVPLEHKNSTTMEMQDIPWVVHGIRVGSYVSVAVIKELAGFNGLDITRMQGKKVRQYGPNQRDKTGRNVSGKFIMNDIASAILFEHQKHACQWIQNPRQVNIEVAPSLLWVESGHANGTGKLAAVDSCDLIALLVSHPKMKQLQKATTKAYVQMETGSIAGIERAVQAATAPSLGQQMLQRGSREVVANGISHEESSVSVNQDGDQVAERLVERGVLLPNGGGIQIQQVAQQVIASGDSGLGKRKISDDLEKVEIRLRNLQCEMVMVEKDKVMAEKDKLVVEIQQMEKQFSMDNEQRRIDNKFSTVANFSRTMELLDPQWRNDKRLVLQATDYMKNTAFKGSSVQQIENGPAESESISIGLVAFEMGVALAKGKDKVAGRHAAAAHRARYGESPSKHSQTIGGNVILVNSYTQKDRDLLEQAIKAAA